MQGTGVRAKGPQIAVGMMSALGQKQTYALQKAMSALPPIATAKADTPQTVMSALPPKADMCPLWAKSRHCLFDHLVGAVNKRCVSG
jgi:hypothetical protein